MPKETATEIVLLILQTFVEILSMRLFLAYLFQKKIIIQVQFFSWMSDWLIGNVVVVELLTGSKQKERGGF